RGNGGPPLLDRLPRRDPGCGWAARPLQERPVPPVPRAAGRRAGPGVPRQPESDSPERGDPPGPDAQSRRVRPTAEGQVARRQGRFPRARARRLARAESRAMSLTLDPTLLRLVGGVVVLLVVASAAGWVMSRLVT